MPVARRHLIRIYEQAGGYGLYVGDPFSELNRHALDHESEEVSKSYLLAQRRLDNVLGTKRAPWSMTFRRDGPRSPLVVAYGSHIELTAEHGQSGIIFLHAVELSDSDFLYTCVNGIVRFLSNAGIRELRHAVLNVATGKSSSDESATQIAKKLEGFIAESPADPNRMANDKLRIKSVEQDCAGAASVAWLTLALQQAKAIPPWEVYDEVRDGENIITAASGPFDESTRASDIQRQSLWQYFSVPMEAEVTHTIQPTSEKPADVKLNEPLTERPTQVASASLGTVQATDQPEKSKSRLVRISALAPVVPGVLTACVVLFFIYNSNRQHRDLLNVLNRIAGGVEQRLVSGGKPNDLVTVPSQVNQSAPPVAQPTPQERQVNEPLLQTIARMFSPNEEARNNAIIQLRRDTASHEEMIPLALQYAKQNQANADGVENTLMVFQRVDPATLKKHRDAILNFIEEVKNGNEKIAAAAEKVRSLVNSP